MEKWSGQQDLNLRPSAPKADALPGCAMPRHRLNCHFTRVFRFETQGSVSELGEGKRSETTASERKYCKSTANFRPFARHSTAQCAYASCWPALLGRGELLTSVAKSQQFPTFAL